MKRIKSHKIKKEKLEPSSSFYKEQEDHDLAYYIHDRVQLVHEVFSAIRLKDLKAMTPECIRHLSTDHIKELCTEELLGISSKRLCAILDGAQPPSETDSSSPSLSPDRLETISLDSISSDEDILSQTSSKKNKKHKHRRRDSKSKKKTKKSKQVEEEAEESSRASRAGLTVLELLELQARARAIRAQLQQEQVAKHSTDLAPASNKTESSSDDEVEVKEEPAEVVEISSSEDEKTQISQDKPQSSSKESENTENTSQKVVTKRINDLIITVPQTKSTKRIKLKRNKVVAVVSTPTEKTIDATSSTEVTSAFEKPAPKQPVKISTVTDIENLKENTLKPPEKTLRIKEKQKKKLKKKEKKRTVEKDGSDHDEISLQLSDSEKMDLLEDLDVKCFDKVSSSSSEDSESSSSDSEVEADTETDITTNDNKTNGPVPSKRNNEVVKPIVDSVDPTELKANTEPVNNFELQCTETTEDDSSKNTKESSIDFESNSQHNNTTESTDKTEEVEKQVELDVSQGKNTDEQIDNTSTQAIINNECEKDKNIAQDEPMSVKDNDVIDKNQELEASYQQPEFDSENLSDTIVFNVSNEDKQIAETTPTETTKKDNEKDLSEGELSERDSSEVEALDLKPEVVCISDEETSKSHKKKKKKEKKSKKEKSKKSKSDFREGGDQNFYKNTNMLTVVNNISVDSNDKICNDKTEIKQLNDDTIRGDSKETILINKDDVYEILELSDDSSSYEVEGTTLSKEPTAEEIEALSAKIDEIEDRQEVITEEEIRVHEEAEARKNEENLSNGNVEHISWKDRYLECKKVKRVLNTSNILNALRKKNKELKRKLVESKSKEVVTDIATEAQVIIAENKNNLEEGSIDQYNTLEASTKYVDPVKEKIPENEQKEVESKEVERTITREMKEDAKQILKMYKRLLKYNDIKKHKDPNKKKKKKTKKKKDDKELPTVASV
ncbi:LOW QUALITY PROTEIN: uncharacterized protein ACR2FA_010444 [Aphomia sociella]